MTLYSLTSDERLRLLSQIELLFHQGRSFIVNSLRIIYLIEISEKPTVKVLVSVPRKKFKKAVFRNRIKRLLREAYRLNKSILITNNSRFTLHIAFIYTGDKHNIEYSEIEKWMISALNHLNDLCTSTETEIKKSRC